MCDFSNTLYVIFHGSWAFVENQAEQDCFHAYAANVPEHTYIAGSWLGEIKIEEGSTLELRGVAGDADGKPDCVRNHADGFVLFPNRQACPVGAYAEIRLPRPKRVWPEMVARDVPVTTAQGETTAERDANLGLVPVFEYDIVGVPQLWSLPADQATGKPFWQAHGKMGSLATTLHVFATDDVYWKGQPKKDFRKVAKLLGYDATTIGKKPTSTSVQTPGLRGRRAFEVTTFLYERVLSLENLGMQMQCEGIDGDLEWVSYAAADQGEPKTGPERVHGLDLSSCGGGGGGS